MLSWLSENIGTILVFITVAVIVLMICISMYKNKKSGKNSCGCGCQDCPMSDSCHKGKVQLILVI